MDSCETNNECKDFDTYKACIAGYGYGFSCNCWTFNIIDNTSYYSCENKCKFQHDCKSPYKCSKSGTACTCLKASVANNNASLLCGNEK